MNIAVIGSTGRAGSRIVTELTSRGHNVVGISRHEERGLKKSLWDLGNDDLKGFEVVVSAFATWDDQGLHLQAAQHLDRILASLPTRWYTVGGAGSLFVAEGLRLKDSPAFPPEYKDVADGMAAGLDYLKSQGTSLWSYFSPAALFEPGERTGRYRFGEDRLLADAQGISAISMEDYAVAMADAIEGGLFLGKRFTAVRA